MVAFMEKISKDSAFVKISQIFKAYDVRGIYPGELNEQNAELIGKSFAKFLGAKTIAIGRDCRKSSDSLFTAISGGITGQGANVVDLGVCSTDCLYFAVGKFKYDGGIMITASHNPKEYNGFKFCKEKAIPLSLEKGLDKVLEIALENEFSNCKAKGKISQKFVLKDFVSNCLSFIDSRKLKPLKIVVDAGNGVGGLVFEELSKKTPFEIIPLFFEPDGNFPNHLPSPIEKENIEDLRQKVLEEKANLGLAFDGDADRVFFVDENGNTVSSGLISALLAKSLLSKKPNSKILFNVPSSKIVKETIANCGGIPVRSRVGHAIIKNIMRNENVLFGCEHSGHYYFKENFFADSGLIAALIVLEIACVEKKPFSEILKPFEKFFSSGELNFGVLEKDRALRNLKNVFLEKQPIFLDELDGLTVEFKDWWFNARTSNTEPLLRLNVEADSKKLLEEKLAELKKIIEKFN